MNTTTTEPAAAGASPDADAELIRLCNRVVAIRREERLICIADEWAPDHGPHHARYLALWEELVLVQNRIYDLDGPTTPAGIRAVAEAALFTVDRARDGALTPKDIDGWLLLSLAEYHAGAEFEAEVVRLVATDNRVVGA